MWSLVVVAHFHYRENWFSSWYCSSTKHSVSSSWDVCGFHVWLLHGYSSQRPVYLFVLGLVCISVHVVIAVANVLFPCFNFL